MCEGVCVCVDATAVHIYRVRLSVSLARNLREGIDVHL